MINFCVRNGHPGNREPVDERGYFELHLKFCPRQAWAEGYGVVSTLKIVDIPPYTLGAVETIQIVLFKSADPVPVALRQENILQTSGAARIVIPAGTTFLEENGNEAVGD